MLRSKRRLDFTPFSGGAYCILLACVPASSSSSAPIYRGTSHSNMECMLSILLCRNGITMADAPAAPPLPPFHHRHQSRNLIPTNTLEHAGEQHVSFTTKTNVSCNSYIRNPRTGRLIIVLNMSPTALSSR